MNNLTRTIYDITAENYEIHFLKVFYHSLGKGMIVVVSRTQYYSSEFIEDDMISEPIIIRKLIECKANVEKLMEERNNENTSDKNKD